MFISSADRGHLGIEFFGPSAEHDPHRISIPLKSTLPWKAKPPFFGQQPRRTKPSSCATPPVRDWVRRTWS